MTQPNSNDDKGSTIDSSKLLMLLVWVGISFVLGTFLSKPLLIGVLGSLGGPFVEGGYFFVANSWLCCGVPLAILGLIIGYTKVFPKDD